MKDRPQGGPAPSARNPYRLERDEDLETFATAVINEAMGKTATSPRQFGYYSSQAAKKIAQFVLDRFVRKKSQ